MNFAKKRPYEPLMPDPLAYFLTWTTYGTWLPGDERGWVLKGEGLQTPNPVAKRLATERLVESKCVLDEHQREIVAGTIRTHCRFRSWDLLALAVLSNHVHTLVAAPAASKVVLNQFKAWCTRKLKADTAERGLVPRMHWWTKGGSRRHIGDEDGVETVMRYINDCQ